MTETGEILLSSFSPRTGEKKKRVIVEGVEEREGQRERQRERERERGKHIVRRGTQDTQPV